MCRVRALGSRAAGEKMGVSWLTEGCDGAWGGSLSLDFLLEVRINDSKW